MEKLRPLDAKLQYQIEKLSKTAQSSGVQDSLQYRPRPDLLEKTLTTEQEVAKIDNPENTKPEVYRPAKVNPVYFDDKDSKKTKKDMYKKKQKLQRSEMIKEMRRNASGAPTEVSLRPMYDKRLEEEDKEIEKYEETALHRVNLSKEEKKKRKARLKQAMLDQGRNNADFRIMEEIVKMQEGTAEKEKERQEFQEKVKKRQEEVKATERLLTFKKILEAIVFLGILILLIVMSVIQRDYKGIQVTGSSIAKEVLGSVSIVNVKYC